MEFTVSRNALLQALNHAKCVIFPKGTYNVLKNFVFTFPSEPEPKLMTIHASDGQIFLSESVAITASSSSVDAPGEFRPIAIYYNDILRSIKALDEQPLTFRVHEYQVTVHHSCGRFRLPLANVADEFLGIPMPCPDCDADDGYLVEYEAPGLRSVLSRCKFAMAQDELRPAINGVYMNFTEEFSDYVSSDGHKLVRVRKNPCNIRNEEKEFSLILPSRVVNTLLRILPVTGDVDLSYQKELTKEESRFKDGRMEKYTITSRKAAARFEIDDNISLSFYPVDGKYPRYWTVIPEYHEFEMTLQRRQLIKSVDRLSIFANYSSMMLALTVTDDNLNLRAEDKDFEMEAEENLDCKCVRSHSFNTYPLTIGLKSTSLAATLKSLSSEEVVFRFIDSSRAVIILPNPQPDVEEVTMLLMPMLV